jgi:hypothetical protein
VNRPVEAGMANRGQDQGASRFWTTQCARRYSRLLLLLLDFDYVAIGLTQLGSLGIKPVSEPIAPVSRN